MRRSILRLGTLLLLVAGASAQTPPAGTAQSAGPGPELTVAPPARDAPEKTLEFPLGVGVGRGDYIFVRITISGKEHLFVVDTGMPQTVLDLTLAQALKDILGPPVNQLETTSIQGRRVESPLYLPVPLEAGGQRLKTQGTPMATMDMESTRQASGRPVEGILGMDVLSEYVVRLDFRRRLFELIDPVAFQQPGKVAGKAFAMVDTNPEPRVATAFAGVPNVFVGLDTGLHAFGTITNDILQKVPSAEIGESTHYRIVDAAGETVAGDVRIKRKWSMGDTAFENVPLEMSNYNLIGLRALADFVVTLDFPNKAVYLESIRAQHPPELPNLEFGIALKDGRIIVHNLNEKAKPFDIQVGDQILAVDGKDISKTELWALREQLQKAKTPIINLRRNGQTHEVTLHHD